MKLLVITLFLLSSAHANTTYKIGCYILGKDFKPSKDPQDFIEINFTESRAGDIKGTLRSKGLEEHIVTKSGPATYDSPLPGFRLELIQKSHEHLNKASQNRMVISSDFNYGLEISEAEALKASTSIVDKVFNWINSKNYCDKDVDYLHNKHLAGAITYSYGKDMIKKAIQCKLISKLVQ